MTSMKTDEHINKQMTTTKINAFKIRQSDNQTDRKSDRQPNRQTTRQTDNQTHR